MYTVNEHVKYQVYGLRNNTTTKKEQKLYDKLCTSDHTKWKAKMFTNISSQHGTTAV